MSQWELLNVCVKKILHINKIQMRKKLTRSDIAWSNVHLSQFNEPYTKEALNTEKKQETAPFTLDVKEVANAITTHLDLPKFSLQQLQKRAEKDEKLILVLSIGISILAITSLLCALVSIIIVATNSRTISKLELLLR